MKESLKLVCLVKMVPDMEHFTYDYEKNILVREHAKSVLNPADACALAAALKLKKKLWCRSGCHQYGAGKCIQVSGGLDPARGR